MTTVTAPPMLSPEFAAYLSMSKQQFLLTNGVEGMMHQEGAAYIDATVALPSIAEVPASTNAAIETFMVDASGVVSPTGSNEPLIDAFASAAQQMATAVLAALADFGVEMDPPGYVTASITPCSQINGLAHFDDEHYQPGDGVGFVAIIGDVGGSRVACEPIAHAPVQAGVPVVFDPASAERFDGGDLAVHQAEPERLVIFPQFGQLHAGPPLANAGLDGFRRLLVFRATTRTDGAEPSMPESPRRRRRRS